jgi:GNAT superfamily N-acetyltransferase
VEPELVLFAEMDGRAVGVLICIRNLNELLLRTKSGFLSKIAPVYVIGRRKRVRSLRLAFVGVLQSYQSHGVGAALYVEATKRFLQTDYDEIEFSWVFDDNVAIKRISEAFGARLEKKWCLYSRDLGRQCA